MYFLPVPPHILHVKTLHDLNPGPSGPSSFMKRVRASAFCHGSGADQSVSSGSDGPFAMPLDAGSALSDDD